MIKDIAGAVFSRLTVLGDTGRRCNRRVLWECLCSCGTRTVVLGQSLRRGVTTSCGCRAQESRSENGRKKLLNRVGQQFGQLLVVSEAPRRNGLVYWRCRCCCGNFTIVASSSLRIVKSCGCLRTENLRKIGLTNRTHGHTTRVGDSPTYRSWASMIQRTTNPKAPNYYRYGGRGITVCARWNTEMGGSFEAFLEDMGERPEGMTLDRNNNNLGYYKENCRWATPSQQQRNKNPFKRRTCSAALAAAAA
jgi:hypothetical protein